MTRMTIVWQVLEMAKEVGDDLVIGICRRMTVANRMGRKINSADWQFIVDFREAA